MKKKTYEELEAEARVLYSEISALDALWEKETEAQRLAKLESRLERIESRRERILDRMDKITDAEAAEGDLKPGKEVTAPANGEGVEEEGDEFVCPDCGGDLEAVGDNLYECVLCREVYEVE